VPDWLAAVALGLIEGLTEFLPVSSTGHLLLAETVGGLPRQTDVFNIVIQSGTCAALIAVFAGRLGGLFARFRERDARSFLGKLLIAVVITGVGLLVVRRLGWSLPKTGGPVAWATLLGGVVILAAERWLRGRPMAAEVTWAIAVAVGIAQLVAGMFPGTSRSAATILVALGLGLSRPAATEFSFLVGLPTLLAAGAFEVARSLRHPSAEPTDWAMVAVGTVVAALAALLVVRWLLRFVRTHTFVGFGWYRVALGLVILTFADRSA
jgi:undecaprenyl-diphosphatase